MKRLHFKDYSLKTKLILLCLLLVFLPLLLVSQIMLKVSENRIIEQTTELTRESAEQTKNNLEDLLNEYAGIITRFTFDSTLQNYLNPRKKYLKNIDIIDAYQYYLKPLTYDFTFQYTTNTLKIYYLNQTLMPGLGVYEKVDNEIRQMEEYYRAVHAGFDIVWGMSGDSIYLSRAIRNVNGALYGVVSIKFPERRLYSLIQESDPEEKQITIINESGTIISSNVREDLGNRLHKNTDDTNYKYIHGSIQGSNLPAWEIITQVPLEDLRKDARQLRNVGLLFTAVTMVCTIALFIILLNLITKRIKKLVDTMSLVKKGTFAKVDIDGGKDEVGELARSFNVMIDSLEKSIQENYIVNLSLRDAKIKKREAELYALQSQINPHFLFNTLESIRMKLITSDDHEEAAHMVLNLSKILRKTLNWHGDMVPLKEEIDFVRGYLEIQKGRFKDKIETNINIPESLEDILIPKLIIQPLVENAVKHGIENKKEKGTIHIYIQMYEEKNQIVVCDNGIGIKPGNLERIRTQLSHHKDIHSNEDHSIGIKNVHDRVVLQYGQPYGLILDSIEGKGTVVKIDIPKKRR